MPIVISNPVLPSTPWSIASATYDTVDFSIVGQDTNSRGQFFSVDGTKYYMTGLTDRVYQYALSSAWDLSTATTVGVISVAVADDGPQGVYFSPDGTRMYIAGTSGDIIIQYTLSTPWLVTSASFIQNKSILSVDSGIQDLFFKNDGTKMYMAGSASDKIYELDLGTAWDISTLTNNGVFLDVSGQDGNISGIFIRDNGTQLFACGTVNGKAYQYTFGTPWDVSTLTYDNVDKSLVPEDNAPASIYVKPDGTKFYTLGIQFDKVYQYSM